MGISEIAHSSLIVGHIPIFRLVVVSTGCFLQEGLEMVAMSWLVHMLLGAMHTVIQNCLLLGFFVVLKNSLHRNCYSMPVG